MFFNILIPVLFLHILCSNCSLIIAAQTWLSLLSQKEQKIKLYKRLRQI